ncbi:glycosyltransferase family 2 protein [Cytobacillus kochii]|uniref:glycosyltransferase family 2 protein n=1 Tax=Cytobacillus kochii TaxID=859143 RepID=UPI001CD2F384|nr:glycosyltransferase [Cytobacillus kochii]MCA1028995.1 glycosyltransferase family 2 protein [Cytobacillus kochii]
MFKVVLLLIMAFFWFLLIYYTILLVSGVLHYKRERERKRRPLLKYPSVAILIPAHNEGLILEDTLNAMMKLRYPGHLDVFLLDDQSIDQTAAMARSFAENFSRIHYIKVPPGEPKGKSRVLNYGLSISQSDYFLVYDADNQPDSDAVTKLVEIAEQTENAAGAVGVVRTLNQNKNWLTRMISIEFQVFQLTMQSGRWKLFNLGSLPGTNMLLRRSVIDELEGYDPYALAEDAELTIRITQKGYVLPIVPYAQTWEQEPENLQTFLKQRTRWLIGNLYLLEKSFKDIHFWKGKTFFHSMQHLLTYFVFIFFLITSNVIFVGSLFGINFPEMAAPLLMIWLMSYVVYSIQIISSLAVNQQLSLTSLFVGAIMYFTYAQLFVILLIRAFAIYLYHRVRGLTIGWDKTTRFKADEKDEAA